VVTRGWWSLVVLGWGRQPDHRVSDPRPGRQAWVPSLRFPGRVDGPGEGQRQAGYRVAAGALAAVRAVMVPFVEEVAQRPSRDAATRGW